MPAISLAASWYWASVSECRITQSFRLLLFYLFIYFFLEIVHFGTHCGVQADLECCLLKPIKGIYNQDKLVVYPTSFINFLFIFCFLRSHLNGHYLSPPHTHILCLSIYSANIFYFTNLHLPSFTNVCGYFLVNISILFETGKET